MGVKPVEFAIYCSITENVAKQVKKFLLGDESDENQFERKNSVSSSESVEKFCPSSEKTENVDSWNDWGDEEPKVANENDESPWNWLFRCGIKTFSEAEFILVTWESRFVVLSKQPADQKYKIICKQWISGEPVSSEITASSIFGLSNTRHSDQLDFLVVALGTLDGNVYFYTGNGTLLFFERFSIYEHVHSVQFESVRSSQLLLIVFSTTFFMVDPISLNSALRQAKSMIAKGEKTAQQMSEIIELQCDLIEPDIKSKILHIVYTGFYKPSAFEQYTAAAWQSFNSRIERPSLPTYSTFLITTDKCFVSFVWYTTEEKDEILTEVIKYGKSFLPTFGIRKYFGISTEPAKKAAHLKSAQHAPVRSEILDARIAQTVSRSPDCRFVAIVDRLARVLIVDVIARSIVLMFKGYRDASISWISSVHETRFAQFLAIFAPRRSLLEVWTILGNVRVCGKHVNSSYCDLIAGGEMQTLCGSSFNHNPQNAFFINETGEFNQLIVPFHLALNGATSQNQHDQLLFKQIEKLNIHDSKWFDTFATLKMINSRKIAFQNQIGNIKTKQEIHEMLSKLKSIESAQSLGNLIKIAEKRAAFYERIINGKTNQKSNEMEEEEEEEKLEIDSMIKKIVEKHFEQIEQKEKIEILPLGEWIINMGFEENSTICVFSNQWTDESRLKLANLIFSPLMSSSYSIQNYFDVIIEKLSISKLEILKLLCLRLEHFDQCLKWSQFIRISNFLAKLNEEKELKAIKTVDKSAINCKSVSHAIIILAICWWATKKEEKKRKPKKKLKEKEAGGEEEEEEEEDEEDWDSVSPEMEHLDSMILCLHAVKLAQKLNEKEPELRIADVALKIDSYCRESIAKWIVNENIEMEQIDALFPQDPIEDLEEINESQRKEKMIIDIPEEKLELIDRMLKIMPRTFEHDLVVADTCWEIMSRWFREPDINFKLLPKSGLLMKKSIIDTKLRHGICRLIWEKFLAEKFESIVMFVEKTSRMPKEKEARKEVGFSEIRVVEFLKECTNQLEILMKTVKDVGIGREFKHDELIQMANSSFGLRLQIEKGANLRRQDELITIAYQQKLVNYHLVLHHFHLALALKLQLTVGLRLHILRTLFCTVGNRAFFVRLDSHPLIPLDRVDNIIMERRHGFLTKIAEQGSIEERREAKILENEWNLSVTAITFMQALTAFRIGNDELGEKEMASCVRDDRSTLALTRLLAARIVRLMMEKNTIMIPAHSAFIHNIAGDETARIELSTIEEGENSENRKNPKNWLEAVVSIGKTAALVAQSSSTAVPIVKMNDIAKQYWGIQWI